MNFNKARIISAVVCVMLFFSGSLHAQEVESIVLKGKLKNYKGAQLTFQYQPYSVFSLLKTEMADVKEDGSFALSFEESTPLRGFFSLGKVPVSEKFTFAAVSGGDSTRSSDTFDSRLVYVYLQPGEELFVSVDADQHKKTLKFKGKHATNSYFMNVEDQKFNQYKDRFVKNWYAITAYQPEAFLKLVDQRKNEQMQFLQSKAARNISPQLKEIFKWNYIAEAVTRKLYYPTSRKSYLDEETTLPDNYFSFMNDVTLPKESGNLGVSYFYFLSAYLQKKHEMDGGGQNYYDYVASLLSGKALYEYYAFALARDFKRDIYDKFNAGCPYPELARQVKEKYKHLESMLSGNPAPQVVLTDVDGKEMPLSDFKGSYVYIDFWATWCGPCVKEIPSLKVLEKEYHGKNIQFVSISFDSKKDLGKWKNYVKENDLTGVQVWVDADNKSIFSKAFNIAQIPRFVILDPSGNIVDANAMRPSNEDIRRVFDNLEGI